MPQEIGLLPNALEALQKYQAQINDATNARDAMIRVIAETQLGSLDGYTLGLTLAADAGKIIATRKPDSQPTEKEHNA